MIRVAIEPVNRLGLYKWAVAAPVVAGGFSRTPLLDACRALKSLGVDPANECGLFPREWHTNPSLKCRVGVGADTSVSERDRGRVEFCKYRPMPDFHSEEA